MTGKTAAGAAGQPSELSAANSPRRPGLARQFPLTLGKTHEMEARRRLPRSAAGGFGYVQPSEKETEATQEDLD